MKAILLSFFLSLTIISGCGKQNTGLLTQSPTPTPEQSQNAQYKQKEFTADELKKYDGLNGNPAYVAVDGVVYDVTNSKRWKQGMHEGCSTAGYDLTDAINKAPHGKDLLKNMPAVGVLKK